VKHTTWSTGLSFSADGTGVVAHAGNVATRLHADQVGLTGALSEAMARRGFTPTHDRGRVLVDVAVLIAGGGEAIADIDVRRHQSEVLGSVASAPTVWRALDEITPAKDAGIGRFPSREFAINAAWALAASVAADLIAWLRLLALPAALKLCEPKALRYRFLHVPARLTHGARQRQLRFPRTWPWADDLVTALTAIRGLTPLRT